MPRAATITSTAGTAPAIRGFLVVLLAVVLVVTAPSGAGAMTLEAPRANERLDHLNVWPTFVVQPGPGERPRWILVGERRDMASPIRYCRAFHGQQSSQGWAWACRSLAIGVDQFGRDVTRPLEAGKTYFWRVDYVDADGAERSSAVRPVVINSRPQQQSIAQISNDIMASVHGSETNQGAALFRNSGVRVNSIRSRHMGGNRFRIEIRSQGPVRVAQSFVVVRGPGGTQRLPLRSHGGNRLSATWTRPAASVQRNGATHRYQATLVSNRNGARVRSEVTTMVFRGNPVRVRTLGTRINGRANAYWY